MVDLEHESDRVAEYPVALATLRAVQAGVAGKYNPGVQFDVVYRDGYIATFELSRGNSNMHVLISVRLA